MSDILLSYVNFGLFLGILYYFGRKPLHEMSRKRYLDFERSFQESDSLRRTAETKCQEMETKLAKMDVELFSLREQLRTESIAESDRIIAEAKTLAENIKNEAVRQAEAEVLRAKVELQNSVLVQVQSAVIDEIKKSLSTDQHMTLIDRQLSHIRLVGE